MRLIIRCFLSLLPPIDKIPSIRLLITPFTLGNKGQENIVRNHHCVSGLCVAPYHLSFAHHHSQFVLKMATISQLHALDGLRTAEQIRLLDLVDSLRAEGLSEFTALPQLIVCGDQSSGKSSLLEAISGVPFPRKDNLCTRFATEVILRRAVESEIKVFMVSSLSQWSFQILRHI